MMNDWIDMTLKMFYDISIVDIFMILQTFHNSVFEHIPAAFIFFGKHRTKRDMEDLPRIVIREQTQ